VDQVAATLMLQSFLDDSRDQGTGGTRDPGPGEQGH
jgi:hypothetical protein